VAELRLQSKDAERRAGQESRRAEAAAKELEELRRSSREEAAEAADRFKAEQRRANQLRLEVTATVRKLQLETQRYSRQKEHDVKVFREVSGRAL